MLDPLFSSQPTVLEALINAKRSEELKRLYLKGAGKGGTAAGGTLLGDTSKNDGKETTASRSIRKRAAEILGPSYGLLNQQAREALAPFLVLSGSHQAQEPQNSRGVHTAEEDEMYLDRGRYWSQGDHGIWAQISKMPVNDSVGNWGSHGGENSNNASSSDPSPWARGVRPTSKPVQV